MTEANLTDPCDELGDLKEVAAFLSCIVSNMGFYGFGGDLTNEELSGLAHILTWLRNRMERSEAAVRERVNTAEMNALRGAGLPEEAFRDERLRAAWRSGFAACQSAAEKGAAA